MKAEDLFQPSPDQRSGDWRPVMSAGVERDGEGVAGEYEVSGNALTNVLRKKRALQMMGDDSLLHITVKVPKYASYPRTVWAVSLVPYIFVMSAHSLSSI
jgi:hypothetical protein